MNGAGGGESKASLLLLHKIDPSAVMREGVNFEVSESATLESAAPPPPSEIMDVPQAPPPGFLEQNQQHDTAQSPELPSPEAFEDIMRTSGHYHGVLEQLRRAQVSVSFVCSSQTLSQSFHRLICRRKCYGDGWRRSGRETRRALSSAWRRPSCCGRSGRCSAISRTARGGSGGSCSASCASTPRSRR